MLIQKNITICCHAISKSRAVPPNRGGPIVMKDFGLRKNSMARAKKGRWWAPASPAHLSLGLTTVV